MEMWNSIDNLKSLSHSLMWASAIFAILAAVATGIRYYVDSRVSALFSHAQKVETEIKEKSQREREAALKLQVEAEAAKLEKERSARLQIETKIAPRRLSDGDKKALIKALKPFAGQKSVIASMLGNAESKIYANDFVEVLDAAGWDHSGDNGIIESVWSDAILGIQITIHESTKGVGAGTNGILALIKTARALGLTEGPEFYVHTQVPPGVVEIRIGAKR